MFRYKIDVLAELKKAGFSSYRIRQENLLPQKQITDMRNGKVVGIITLDKVCNLLNCDICDIIEHVKDNTDY